MTKEEILSEISKKNKIIAETTLCITELTEKLKNMSSEDSDWVSVKEASLILKVCTSTIYNLINAGRLECKHVGAKKFVKKTELLAIDDRYRA